MVSNVRYYSFKEFHFRHRQPFWSLILGIILIQLIIAEPQIMLFSIFSLYTLSGPMRAVIGLWRGEKQGGVGKEEASEVHQNPRALDSDKQSSL
jgi:CDP-diacylglycerol--serine O-phosphatidyltransferase